MNGWTRSEKAWFFGCASFVPLNLALMAWNISIGHSISYFVAGISFAATVSVVFSVRRQWRSNCRIVEIRADIERMDGEIQRQLQQRANANLN